MSTLQNFRNVSKFARKQIRPSDGIETLAGHLERRNLEVVKRLGNEHIVEIAFSYREIRDGQQLFNLVFPCATANLHDCLRLPEKNFNSSLYRPGPIYDCELWEQILGVADALYRIAERASEPSDEVGHDLLGYHFDLKPANILVYRRGKQWIFKITDFGQAKFKRASGANSNTRRKGGDEEYAPPEIDTADAIEQQQSRRYDVFSLGCIFLEMTSFLVRGYDGVADIDVARGKSPGPNQSDGRYCLSPTATTPALLKPQINEHRDDLLAHMQNGEMFAADEKHFIEKILGLIWGMLQPKVSDRYTSRGVVDELQALLNEEPRASKAPNPGGFSAQQQEPLAEEKEIGQPDLGRLK
jgi:serine/threonine protein kinase